MARPVADMACGKAQHRRPVSPARPAWFCGSRVGAGIPLPTLLHIVHGPIWLRGLHLGPSARALSSGPRNLHRNSFSTDLQEMDVIFGGEKKLKPRWPRTHRGHHQPKAAFIYSTCIVGTHRQTMT